MRPHGGKRIRNTLLNPVPCKWRASHVLSLSVSRVRRPCKASPHNIRMAPRNRAGVTKAHDPKLACDRCRGQKLRCDWEEGARQCRRCARAKALCTIPPPRPMGRPQRQSRRNGHLGWEDSHMPTLEENASAGMLPAEDMLWAGSENASTTVGNSVVPSDAVWSLAPPASMPTGGKTGLQSPAPAAIQPGGFDFLSWYVLQLPCLRLL